jgi:hypothetical protein
VEGLSGTGKSSVYEELIRRGYTAVSTDRAWKYFVDPDTGLPGGPAHYDNLRIDDDTMRRRLQERTDNTYGKQPWELGLMLKLIEAAKSRRER